MKKCLFLDRDGIINKDVGYASRPEQFEFMPGIFDLCRRCQKNGYLIIIITNQSGIARGYYSEEDLKKLHTWLSGEFAKQQITLTDIFHCPHHPDITGHCNCRKPEPGMLLTAINKYQIAPQSSMMLGDKESDMIAAQRAGITDRILLTDKVVPESVATWQICSLTEIFDKVDR